MATGERRVRYEPHEVPPKALTIGLACQYVVLFLGGVVITPAIIIRAADGADAYILWAAFAALLISGITTVLQAISYKRIGAGYILFMGTSGAFIAISIKALSTGSISLLATLLIASSLFQFLFAWKLSFFRRIITSTVGGTIIMLVAVTVMPIVFDLLDNVPQSASTYGAPISALVTLLCIIGIIFKSTGILRLWAPVVGLVVGSIVAAFFGIFDTTAIARASWVGLPLAHFPSFSLDFSSSFWLLLPAFIFVTLVGAIETVGDTIAVQQVSWRKPRSTDYRSLQGSVFTDGIGNLLAGLLASIPNTTYSTGISLIELTGVAARRVGIWVGIILVLFAFSPKLTATLLSIPNPVAGAYFAVLIALLFVTGMKLVVQKGDYSRCLIASIGFWLGYGFQAGLIFPAQLKGGAFSLLLENGMSAGGLVTIFLAVVLELAEGMRRYRLKVQLHADELPIIHEFLRKIAAKKNWNEAGTLRLCATGEETILNLIEQRSKDNGGAQHLLMSVRGNRNSIELECIASPSEQNLEDRMVLLKEGSVPGNINENELSLRILRGLSSSFEHQQFHKADIITVRVSADSHHNVGTTN